MRIIDFSPLYRSTVGFDRLFDMLDRTWETPRRATPIGRPTTSRSSGDDHYRITMAVAGFTPEEIELAQQENTLLVEAASSPSPGRQFLYRGIATRAFRQTFNLADYVKVNGANLENGLLVIDLVREVPEAMKPRRIEIAGAGEAKTIEHDSQPKVEKAKAA